MARFCANLSMLFNEVNFLDRFKLAANNGFSGVEYLFPYDYDADEIKFHLDKNQLEQVLFNLPAGNWEQGERGIACMPNRMEEFKTGVDQAIAYAKILGNKTINCLAGITPSHLSYKQLEETFIQNINYAANKLKENNIKLVIEMINTKDIPGFFLNTTRQAKEIIKKANNDNIFLQYDIYHMQIMEGDLACTIEENIKNIKHIQLADNPGRNEPGTGEINYRYIFNQIDKLGYQGWIGCEYKPKTNTIEGLAWLKTHNVI